MTRAPSERASKLAYYRDTQGFDRSKHVPFTRHYRIRCSACEACVINSIPCHETGCPHDTRECAGCNATIAANSRYCADCA